MMSLFSSFDLLLFRFSLIWMFSSCIFLFSLSFKKTSFSSFLFSLNSLKSFFYSLKPKSFTKFSMMLCFSLISTIVLVNLFSVFSFNFPLTSSFGAVMSFSLSFWGGLVLFSLFNNISSFLSHFVPEGAPIFLSLILFVIELISSLIRPLTLTVRLVANILAGHLLMILLSKLVFLVPLFFLSYFVLNLIEMFVAMIQAYIFCTMAVLYFSEIH